MKKVLLFPMMMMGLTLSFSACSDDDPDTPTPTPAEEVTFEALADFSHPSYTGNKPTEEQMSATVTTYVDDVVLPTYAEMLDKMEDYHAAIVKFVASQSQNDLDDACAAWRAVRVPWEESEAFLYGVADLGQYDPSLDSWPLDKGGIDEIIANGDFTGITGDSEASQNLRGFHTAERMLFSDGESRNLEETPFTENELQYLQIVSDRMLKDTQELYQGWAEGLGNDIVPTSYAEAMKSHDGSAYAGLSSVYQAIETMLNGDNGMGGISNEVGTAKIKDPIDAWKGSNQDATDPDNPGVLAVESWYSWNSIDDYANNIVSIKNSYFGGRDLDAETAAENSLHTLCQIVNPTLDSLMVIQIDATIDAIQGIPYPFRNNLGADTENQAAMDACAELTRGLDVIRAALTSQD